MELWAWGANNYGQLGLGQVNEQCNEPVQVPLPIEMKGILTMATGGGHTMLVDTNGNRLVSHAHTSLMHLQWGSEYQTSLVFK